MSAFLKALARQAAPARRALDLSKVTVTLSDSTQRDEDGRWKVLGSFSLAREGRKLREALEKFPGAYVAAKGLPWKWDANAKYAAALLGLGAPVFDPAAGPTFYRPPFAPEGLYTACVEVPRFRKGTEKDEDREAHDRELWLAAVAGKLFNDKCAMASVGSGGVTLAAAPGKWREAWAGVEIEVGKKTMKRAGQLLRPMKYAGACGARFEAIDDPNLEKVLDGIVFVRRSVAEKVIRGTELAHRKKTLIPKEEAENLRLEDAFEKEKRRDLKGRLFNFRWFTPHGLVKGNCVLVPDAKMPEGVDVFCHACNVKPEVKSEQWVMGLDPQPPKPYARTSTQMVLALPQLFPLADLKQWAEWKAAAAMLSITEGTYQEDLEALAELDREREQEHSFYRRIRWSAIDFIRTGHGYRHSPLLGMKLFESQVGNLIDEEGADLNLPIPCAVYAQVVSNTTLRLAGEEKEIEEGTLRYFPELGLAAVSDADWEEMLESHGGCDQDDKFTLVYRTVAGEKKVVVLRHPIDRGEYSVFRYVEGDFFPTAEVREPDGQGGWLKREVTFPPADLTGACKRVSEAMRAGEFKVSPPQVGDAGAGEEVHAGYTKEYVWAQVRRLADGLNPGKVVNAKMLWNCAFPDRQLAEVPGTMEKIIDACTQGGSKAEVDAYMDYGKSLIREVVCSDVPVDASVWATRSGKAFARLAGSPRLVKGTVTQALEHVKACVAAAKAALGAWLQANHVTPPALEALPLKEAGRKWLEQRVKDFRKDVHGAVSKGLDTQGLHDALKAELLAKGGTVAHLAKVVHSLPTARDKAVSDSLLWNPAFFADYLAAIAVK